MGKVAKNHSKSAAGSIFVTERLEIRTASEEQTHAAGLLLGGLLEGGEVIELCGPLGAGKTQFAKGLALGLGVPVEEPVVSPTFVLVRQYSGRLTFYHCDAYRLHAAEELESLGLDEVLGDPDAVVAIEWADRFPNAFDTPAIRVDLAYQSGTNRLIRLTFPSAEPAEKLADKMKAIGQTIIRSPKSNK